MTTQKDKDPHWNEEVVGKIIKAVPKIAKQIQDGEMQKMKRYKFELQSYVEVIVEAENEDEARLKLIDSQEEYKNDLINKVYISDGKEVQYD